MAQKPRAEEQPAVKTTIVGGRPPGAGKKVGAVPRGIEVLIKKAAVDPAFCARLLERRAGAADEIGLALSASERAMLGVVPESQLRGIIENTRVPREQVPALLSKTAAVMLAALGLIQVLGCDQGVYSAGIRPEDLPKQGAAQTQPATRAAPEAAGDNERVMAGVTILGLMARQPTTTGPADGGLQPGIAGTRPMPPTTTAPASEPIEVAGATADRPPRVVIGIQPAPAPADEEPATTQGTGGAAPAVEPLPVPPPMRVAGVMVESRTTRGVQPDRPATTQAATESASQPAPDVKGVRPDRPEVQKGVRADRP